MEEKKDNKVEKIHLTDEEKEELKREGQLPKRKIIKKETKQTIFIFAIIAVFFAAFLVPYFYVQNQRIFEYNNLTWQVEKDGEITFYHTMFGKYYKGMPRGNHHTYLRNDPRKNEIPIDIGKPEFYNKVIISTDPKLLECEKQILATDALGQMTIALSFVENLTYAVTDENYAKENDKNYRTCDNVQRATVIEVLKGDESKITKDESGDCYFVEIGTCEDNLKTAERLVLEVITHLRNTQPVTS